MAKLDHPYLVNSLDRNQVDRVQELLGNTQPLRKSVVPTQPITNLMLRKTEPGNYTRFDEAFALAPAVNAIIASIKDTAFKYLTAEEIRFFVSSNNRERVAKLINLIEIDLGVLEVRELDEEDLVQLIQTKIGYQFPSEEVCQAYLSQSEEDWIEGKYINLSRSHLDAWVNRLVEGVASERTFSEAISGKVGSGKSSFIRHLKKQYSDRFLKNKIAVVSLVYEYSKIDVDFKKEGFERDWRKFFCDKALNLLVTKLIAEPSTARLLKTEEFEKWLSEQAYYSNLSNDERRRFDNVLAELLRKPKNIEYVRRVELRVKEQIVLWFDELEFSFLVVFDGFDVFALDEIVKGNQQDAFDALSDIVIKEHTTGILRQLNMNFLVTLRDCTYTKFCEGEYRESARVTVNQRMLIPAGVSALSDKALKHFIFNNCDKEALENQVENIKTVFRHVDSLIQRSIELERGEKEDISSITNSNLRKYLNFFSVILIYLLTVHLKKVSDDTLWTEIIEGLVESLRGPNALKEHTVVELLLLSKFNHFSNYFTFNSRLDANHGQPNDQKRGFLDNVLNYHKTIHSIHTDGRTPWLLIKLRLLQILEHADMELGVSHLSETELIGTLSLFGYTVTETQFEVVETILVNANFIKMRWIGAEIRYAITPIGKYVVNKLISEFRYLQHIIQATYFPPSIVSFMHGLSRYGTRVELERWVYCSIVNYFVYRKYVNEVENLEASAIADSINNDDESIYLEFIPSSWRISTGPVHENVVKAIVNILYSNIKGTAYLNPSKILSTIEDFVDVQCSDEVSL